MNSTSESPPVAPADDRPTASRPPFSLAEKWLYGGVLLMAVAIVVPLLLGLQAHRLERMVEADLHALQTAADRYFAEYGRWPTARMGTPNDVRYGDERCNSEVMNSLRAVEGPGNLQHRGNPHRIVFLDVARSGFRRSGIDANGAFVDPWGTPYQVALDTDMNETVTMVRSAYPNLMATSVAIWSYGPDRRPDTSQDIVSWE